MWVVGLIIIVAAIVCCLRSYVYARPVSSEVAWSHSEFIACPVGVLCDLLRECFGSPDHGRIESDGVMYLYFRGDPRVRRVGNPPTVRLSRLPTCLAIAVGPGSESSIVVLRLSVRSDVRISPSAARHFDGDAQDLLRAAGAMLREAASIRQNGLPGLNAPEGETAQLILQHLEPAQLGK